MYVARYLLLGFLCLSSPLVSATEIRVQNADEDGEGFNDPEAREPVGGNPGTTLGEQRLIAMRYAADLVASRVRSSITIVVSAEFNDLECSLTQGVLGRAGTTRLVTFNTGRAPRGAVSDTWYPIALANALDSRDANGGAAEIEAEFNSRIEGDPRCLGGDAWYYGLDDDFSEGNEFNFIATAAHELIHSLGFAMYADLESGEFFDAGGETDPLPSIYSSKILDLEFGRLWPELSASQRAESATNDPDVVWHGMSTNAVAAERLEEGRNQGRIRLHAPCDRSTNLGGCSIQEGSSISHWSSDLSPDGLMEPFVSTESQVTDGIGLAACLLQDIGWSLVSSVNCPDDSGGPVPEPRPGEATSVSSNEDSGGGGGGGCTLGGDTGDPLWPLMLLLALAGIAWRPARAR